jgi:hypothetical protein
MLQPKMQDLTLLSTEALSESKALLIKRLHLLEMVNLADMNVARYEPYTQAVEDVFTRNEEKL